MTKIGFWRASSLIVGNMLGVGIFTTAGVVAGHLRQPGWILLAWLIGGAYALNGGMVYGFLARDMPFKGGDYVYLKENFSPFWAYLFGWSALFITYTGSIAALAIGAAHYLNAALPGQPLGGIWFVGMSGIAPVAALLVLIFTYLNYLGLRTGSGTQIALTAAILAAIIFFSLAVWMKAGIRVVAPPAAPQPVWPVLLKSLPAVFFTYMGWTTVVYLADEVQQPRRTIPRALFWGTGVVILLYLGLNYAVLCAMPVRDLAGKLNVVSLITGKYWGNYARLIVSVMILSAILSSLNSTVLSGPHIYQAMARDGFMFRVMQKRHDRYGTPAAALWIQAGWAVLLLFSGTFEQLLQWVVAAILLFSLMADGVALKIFFTKKEEQTVAHLIVMLVYGLLSLVTLGYILYTQTIPSLIGFVLLLLAVPFYLLQKKKAAAFPDR